MIQREERFGRGLLIGIAMLVGALSIQSAAAHAQCAGDCNGDVDVTINEIITMVNIALTDGDVSTCSVGDVDHDGFISINEILKAVTGALNGCPAPMNLGQVRLTYLQVKYDLSKPLFINNPVPIKFGITSTSADPSHPSTRSVLVSFQFIEATPVDPANPRSCGSNGVELKLTGNGVEQQFEADIYPTSVCESWAGPGAVANLLVDFDAGLRLSGKPTGIDYPTVIFSAANQGAADNQLCRKTLDPNAADPGRGCVYALQLQPTPMGTDGKPLVDIKLDSLKPDSSVAMVWPTAEDPDVPQGMKESDPPSLVVNAVFIMDGRDPYKNQIDSSKLPPEFVAANPTITDDLKFGLTDEELGALDDLPGTATVKYDLVPTSQVASGAWMPLTIDDPKNPNPDGHVEEIDLGELDPGTENGVVHELYIEGDVRTAVSPGGDWANETDFTVRGCLIASFPEGGNTGEEEDPEDVPAGGDVPMGDCKTFKVRLARATVGMGGAAANSHSFDMNWTRGIGGERISVSGTLRSSNMLDLSGARSDSEGTLDLKGRIGSDFSVQLFRAYAKGSALTALATSSTDIGVSAFGVSLFGDQKSGAEITVSMPFTLAKQFQFPALSFGFGPVSIGITAGVGGDVGITPSLTVSAKQGGESSVPALASASSNGMLQVTFKPSAALTGNVTGGIDILVAKAALVATLRVVELGFPLSTTLRWGVTQLEGEVVKQLTVLGEVTWDLMLTWFNVSLDAVGEVKVLFFSKSLTINIFKYETPPETINLLTRRTDPLVLGSEGAPTPTPGGDTPTPGADTPTPGAETPTPGTDTPTPSADTPTPDSDTPTPAVETPTTGELRALELHATPTPIPTRTPTGTPIPIGE